jgi:hypothetical protein
MNRITRSGKNYRLAIRSASVAAVFTLIGIPAFPQNSTEKWLRVLTDETSIVEVDKTSMKLDQDRIVEARFRTKLAVPETIPGMTGVRYQTRLDVIEFNIGENRYRIAQSDLLDAANKVVLSSSANDEKSWTPVKNHTALLLLRAAGQLAPFGIWRIVTYRYVSGEPASEQDPAELKSLIGSYFQIKLNELRVGYETCARAVYSPRTITNDELISRVGISLESLGLPSDRVDTIRFTCDRDNHRSTSGFILRLSANKSLLLWEGVFLEIERPGNPFLP